jgi:hypothetical protein
MFKSFANSLATGKEERKSMSPTLRADIYTAIDQAKSWLIGGLGGGQAGDGVSFGPILTTIQKHFPETNVGLESIAQAESEVAIVVGGITNMVLEMSRWEGMAGGMAMRTWVDTLGDAFAKVPTTPPGRREAVGKGITKGVNERTDVSLMTKEFASKIQIISQLKTGKLLFVRLNTEDRTETTNAVSAKIYGAGSDDARHGEAVWSSKFI